jgi:phage-related protein (TIGR01555 family)
MSWFKKKQEPVIAVESERSSLFSTDLPANPQSDRKRVMDILKVAIPAAPVASDGSAMDASFYSLSSNDTAGAGVPMAQAEWFASHSWIGYNMSAVMMQHWLIDKACLMPARDAIRQGYEITSNGGDELTPEIVEAMQQADRKYGINSAMQEVVHMGRGYGIRVAIFKVKSTDPQYYEKPFNIDGVTPGSYVGIQQVDPMWCAPELTDASVSDPSNMLFYTPVFWRIAGQRYHHSHLFVYIPYPVPKLLKPAYRYGGVSLPQRIYERVYAAERTANEAPQLAMTKRLTVFKTNTDTALANMSKFASAMEQWAAWRDNYGVKICDKEVEDIQQHDTALGDLDTVIMTQYQLVAAIANVPATKLLGTQPKGFNATGEYEAENYRQELECIQSDLTPMLERHHQLVMKSYVGPKFEVSVDTSVAWAALDSPTADEYATINKTKAETDNLLVQMGAIDGMDVRARITADKDSDHFGLAEIVEEQEEVMPEEGEQNGEAQNQTPAD